tara:strand:- start:4084 stop:5388 length:1305 start_codon:yes stop_codon:yes gene_type:complete
VLQINSLLQKVISIFIKKSAVFLIAFLVMIIQARVLGAEARGLLAMLLVLPNLFLIIAESGMRQSTTYFLGKKEHNEKEVLSTSSTFFISSALIFTIILYIAQLYYFEGKSIDKELIVISCLGLPFLVINSGYRGILLGYKKTAEFGNNLLYPKVFQFILIIILFSLALLDLKSVLIVFVLICFANFLAGWFSVNKLSIRTSISSFKIPLLVKMLKLGAVFGLSFFFVNLNYQIGIIVGQKNLSSEAVGNYAVTIQVAELIWQLPAAVSIVFFSESMTKLKHDIKWAHTIAKVCRVQSFITLLICLIGWPACKYILPYIIGEDYNLVANTFLFLIPGIIMMSIFKVINVDFAGRGKPWIALLFMPVIALLNYLLSVKLSIVYGLDGLAIAVSISYLIASLIAICIYSFLFKVKINSFLFPRLSDFSLSRKKINH